MLEPQTAIWIFMGLSIALLILVAIYNKKARQKSIFEEDNEGREIYGTYISKLDN